MARSDYPDTSSNLNLANLAVVQVSAGRAIGLYNLNGDADVVVDVFGYFAPQLTGCTANCAYGWGVNLFGRLGNGTSSGNDLPPAGVYGLTGVTQFAQVAGGTVYALKSDGTVWSWGYCAPGTYGDGTPCTAPSYRDTPGQVTGVVATAIGTDGYALNSDGTMSIWGSNSAVPVALPGISGVTAIGNFGYAVAS